MATNYKLKSATLKLQNLQSHFLTLNPRYLQSLDFHSHAYNKFSTKPRPHKPTRNQLRTSIPFLNDLKQCHKPDEFLSIFQQYIEMGFKHDYPSYASLIYKLAKAKQFVAIDTLLDFLRSHDIKCKEALFIGLIRHYGKADLINKANWVFREMGKSFNCVRTIQSFNTILNVLVDSQRIPDAIDLFEKGWKMRFRLNSVSFNIMIKMWLANGEWEKAQKVLDEMLERSIEPTVVTYNCQIGFLCKRGDVDEAKRLFEDMVKKGKKGNAVTYALLMEGLCSLEKFNEAKKLMFDMEYQGCKVEVVNYGVLINDLAKRGFLDEAKGLLAEMKKRRIKQDVVMYNILINCFCKEGEACEAYKMLVDMQVRGCDPNAATYRMVMDGFCRIGDFVGGLKVLNTMLYSKHLPRIETFYSLVIGLIRSGKIEDAWFVLDEMEKKKVRLNLESWETLTREVCLDDDEAVIKLLDDIFKYLNSI